MSKTKPLWAAGVAVALGAGLLTASPLLAATPHKAAASMVTKADRQFLMDAALGDLAEVKLGKLALSHSHAAAVRTFAQRMVKDHSANLTKVKALAAELGVTLPKEPSSELNGMAEQLAKKPGKAFDQAYLDGMITDHTKDVEDFRKETKSAHDAKVRAFAAQTLPTLEEHLRLAKAARKKV